MKDFRQNTIPEYPYEKSFDTVYSCGCGLCDDIAGNKADESFMRLVKGTNETDFADFCAGLTAGGFAPTYERTDESGIYREFVKGCKIVYTYYIFCENSVRIIADNASVPLKNFAFTSMNEPRTDSALMQYGLYYHDMIRGITCDCGMLYVIRLRNNELIIIDGGEKEQCTVISVADVIERLREMTGTEKITVAAWFCSHPHNDHIDMFTKLIKDMGENLYIKRVMFNFPEYGTVGIDTSLESISRMKKYIIANNPAVRFLKPHSGQHFYIGNAEFDILHTHEDMLTYYPDKPYRGANQTSTVLKITVDGISAVFLADCEEENGEIFLKRYSQGTLTCTFLQAAHHCINEDRNIYEGINARKVLIPQSMHNITPRFPDKFGVICEIYGSENIIVAGDGTKIFTCADGKITDEKTYPVIGTIYDENEL